jgi:hypothetical protein
MWVMQGFRSNGPELPDFPLVLMAEPHVFVVTSSSSLRGGSQLQKGQAITLVTSVPIIHVRIGEK